MAQKQFVRRAEYIRGELATAPDVGISYLTVTVEVRTMPTTIEISDDLAERPGRHCEDDESVAEFVEELVSVYETEGAFLQEGYSE
jgi:hypothetical protein